MSTHKSIDRICCFAIILAILLSCAMAFGKNIGIPSVARVLGYETRLFDTGKVHTIDIEMEDWDSFLANCENEEYAACTLIIDNESEKNVAIRAKGNTSLSNVSQLGSQRYSFKVEFDHYEAGKSYYGLDKLSLNNMIQDNTLMKDYLAYQLMGRFGVDAPLCSYVYVTVNGEDWGLYLAVEGVEDAFLSRNYDGEGNLYKPDSIDMGGGRGHGRDFEMDFDVENAENWQPEDAGRGSRMQQSDGGQSGEMPSMPADGEAPSFPNGEMPSMPTDGEAPTLSDGEMPSMPTDGEAPSFPNGEMPSMPTDGEAPTFPDGEIPSMLQNMGGFGGMNGSADVKLQYIDDDPDSYSNIFENAKTDITAKDKRRLIASLKALSEQENIEDIVDVDAVLRYFVVHDFVCNGDSYTGGMIHNYYLYEKDGKLSMIPWDYNLAFGGFQSSNATSTVNEPIDSPVTNGSIEDRPMVAWIFEDDAYLAQYHELYAQFINDVDFTALLSETKALISAYVERDPSKFCTYEEFETAVQTLSDFCNLRAESVRGQLDGTIPSTTDGQNTDSSNLVDASSITISDMGTMQAGMGGGFSPPNGEMTDGGFTPPDGETTDGGFTPPNGGTTDGGFTPPDGEMTDGGFTPPDGETTDGSFTPSNEKLGFGADQMRGGAMTGSPDVNSMGNRINVQTWLLLGVSVSVLALGLLATKLFRRK